MMHTEILTVFMMCYHHTILTFITAVLGIFYIFPLKIAGFRVFSVYNPSTQRLILSKIKWSTHLDENNKPIGFLVGKHFIGHYDIEKRILNCITTEKEFNQLVMQPSVKNSPEEEQIYINLYYKNNQVEYVYYKTRMFNVTHFKELPNQLVCVDQITQKYEESYNKSVVCLLHGKPNTGKSLTSILVAKKLGGSYCKTYKPIDSGDSFDIIYNTCSPTEKKPLIILLDEFDIILDKIQHKNLKPNEKVLTEVTDKISWNQLFDNISIGFYPYTIVLLTTNLKPETIVRNYDASYIRENRIHLTIEMK